MEMVTTATSTERVAEKVLGQGKGKRRGGGNGNKPGGNGGGGFGGGDDSAGSSGDKYRIGVWIALAAILMMFTALTSAYIVRAAGASDWIQIAMPRLLWFSTALIVISSVTFEVARKALARDEQQAYRRWLFVTAALGLGFLLTQFLSWKQLVAQGVYLSSNPHGAFFYLLTALHGLHLLGGILALVYLLFHALSRREPEQIGVRRTQAAGAVSLYWHFMDGLWVFLFLLLFLWR